MAQKVITSLVDDIDGISEAARTVAFGLDGYNYEIDLSEEHVAALFADLELFTNAARVVGGRGRPARRLTPAGRSAEHKERLSAIREWANKNGWKVSPRGRVPLEVVQAYDAAH